MERINYIASAGTGKTYTLVEKIVDEYIIRKRINIDQIFVSTFTEKAASELKSRIYARIKEKIYENQKNPDLLKLLFSNFRNVQHSYIGTIHSLLLRILKANPDKSGITEDIKVIDDLQQEALFFESFEIFLEKNRERAGILANYFSGKSQIYTVFKNIYANLWKIERYRKESIEERGEYIKKLEEMALKLLDDFINDYYRDFVDSREFLKTDLKDIYTKIKQGRFTHIKVERNKKFPKLLKHKNVKDHRSLKSLDKEKISELEDQLINTLEELRNNALYLNFLVILDNFDEFLQIFEEKKRESHLITYSDIILRSKEIFLRYPDLLEEYRDRFKAFFIDEFQDTDQIQTDIIGMLSERSDLIVFGDPKQCIYEWRSADLYNYINFTEDFDERTLNVCYRSAPSLVGFFNLFFRENDFLNRDYSKSKVKELYHLEEKYIPELFYSSDKSLDITDPVEIVKTESDTEPVALAEKIKQLLNSGYSPEDILVLFRSRSKTERYIQELRKSNIPFISFLSSNFYNSVEVITVLNILKLIQYPYDQLTLLKVLKSPVFSFSDKELYEVRNDLCIDRIPQLKEIKRLEEIKDSLNISQILDCIYRDLPVLEIFSLYPDGKQKVANLEKLKFIADRLEGENFQLRDFIQFLEDNRYKDEEDALITTDDRFVKVMTMHRSKGLEAKVVIIPGLSERINRSTNGFFTVEDEIMVRIRDDYNREVARTLNFDEEKVKRKIYLEEKRLLYVAFTRAKERLILFHSGSKGYMNEIETVIERINGKEVIVYTQDKKPVSFKLEIKITEPAGISNNSRYWSDIIKRQDRNIIEKLKLLEDEEERRKEEFERAVSAKIFTTVSALIDEKDEKSVVEEFQISEDESLKEKDISIETGIIVHKILEYFSFPEDLKEAENEIEELFERFSGLITEDNRDKVKDISLEKLKRFIRSDAYKDISSSRIIFREMPFTLKEGNSYIEGKIDIVYEKDGVIYVGDYKTGRIKDEEKYRPQERYYTEVIKKVYPDREIKFRFIYLI